VCLIRANFAVGVKYVGVGRGRATDVMVLPGKSLLHGAAFTISLCTWVRAECDRDVGGHLAGS
jgi:hypothetical protein